MKYLISVLLGVVMSALIIIFIELTGFESLVLSISGVIVLFGAIIIWQYALKKLPGKDEEYPGIYYAVSVFTILITGALYMLVLL